jgi:two-component system, cell cycle response regulator DivK
MGSKLVLLVEDNQDNREIYTTLLRHVGYEVLEAVDGEHALHLVEQRTPDIVLLDISLPKIDGWQVARRLKTDEATRHVPIAALTAHAYQADRDMARAIGFDAYLAKPVEPRDVYACVVQLIGTPQADMTTAVAAQP